MVLLTRSISIEDEIRKLAKLKEERE